MKWRKLGHIFCADRHSDWLYSHAMIPIAEQPDGDLYRIYFSSRDAHNRGHGAYVEVDMSDPLRVLKLSEKPVLEPGDLGCFDDSGADITYKFIPQGLRGEILCFARFVQMGIA